MASQNRGRYLELTPSAINRLRERLTGTSHGEFLIEAYHLVSKSLCDQWINKGASTPAKLLAKIEEEYDKRRAAATRRSSDGGDMLVAAVLDGNQEDDIPF